MNAMHVLQLVLVAFVAAERHESTGANCRHHDTFGYECTYRNVLNYFVQSLNAPSCLDVCALDDVPNDCLRITCLHLQHSHRAKEWQAALGMIQQQLNIQHQEIRFNGFTSADQTHIEHTTSSCGLSHADYHSMTEYIQVVMKHNRDTLYTPIFDMLDTAANIDPTQMQRIAEQAQAVIDRAKAEIEEESKREAFDCVMHNIAALTHDKHPNPNINLGLD